MLLSLRASYTLKQYSMLILIILDMAFNTVVDSSSNEIIVFALMGAQIAVRGFAILLLLLYLWDTFLFRYGLLGILCQKFAYVFIISPLMLVFLIAIRAMRVVSSTIYRISSVSLLRFHRLLYPPLSTLLLPSLSFIIHLNLSLTTVTLSILFLL
jgi:hypothetical protein